MVNRTYAKIAKNLDLSYRPTGSPVPHGGNPQDRTGSPSRQERQENVEFA